MQPRCVIPAIRFKQQTNLNQSIEAKAKGKSGENTVEVGSLKKQRGMQSKIGLLPCNHSIEIRIKRSILYFPLCVCYLLPDSNPKRIEWNIRMEKAGVL